MKPKYLTDVGYKQVLYFTSFGFSLRFRTNEAKEKNYLDREYACKYYRLEAGYRSIMTEDMGFVLLCYSSFDIKNNRWFFTLQTDDNIEDGFVSPRKYPESKPNNFICFGMSDNFAVIERMWRFPYYAFSDKKYLSITNTERSLSRRRKFEVTEEFEDYIQRINTIIDKNIQIAIDVEKRSYDKKEILKHKFFRDNYNNDLKQ